MKRLGYTKYVAQGRRLWPLSDDERHAYDQLVFFYTKGIAHAQEMGTVRRRCTGSRIHRSAWLHGSSTTARKVTR